MNLEREGGGAVTWLIWIGLPVINITRVVTDKMIAFQISILQYLFWCMGGRAKIAEYGDFSPLQFLLIQF